MRPIYKKTAPLDTGAVLDYGLNEDILMENAAAALEAAVWELYGRGGPRGYLKKVCILAGSGNNGGDGLALARRLKGSKLDVAVLMPKAPSSPACKLQFERAQKVGVKFISEIEPASVFVDALFGSGFRGTLDREMASLLASGYRESDWILACDLPSGIDADGGLGAGEVAGDLLGGPIKADISVAMGAFTVAHFGDMAKDFIGECRVANLGISPSVYGAKEKPFAWLLEERGLEPPYRSRQNVHKGDFGHAVILAGEKMGAAVLAGLAAESYGAGLVTLLKKEGFAASPVAIPPELMYASEMPQKVTALALGMGLGRQNTEEAYELYIKDTEFPVLLDADIFYSPTIKEILKRKGELVLTPHPKEFSALLEVLGLGSFSVAEIQAKRFSFVEKFCTAFPQTVLVLKGANTIVGKGDQFFVCTCGKANLAKGGTGDILAGLITSLLAQGKEALFAATQGVLAHALASQVVESDWGLSPHHLVNVLASERISSTRSVCSQLNSSRPK